MGRVTKPAGSSVSQKRFGAVLRSELLH